MERGVRAAAALSLAAVAASLLALGLWLERPGGRRPSWNGPGQGEVASPGPAVDVVTGKPVASRHAWRK